MQKLLRLYRASRRHPLEIAYNNGILGGGIRVAYQCSTPASYTKWFLAVLGRIAHLRQRQCIVDALVRVAGSSHPLCAPHLPSTYSRTVPVENTQTSLVYTTRTAKKWHVLQKTRASLGEALFYAVQRCRSTSSPTTYRGVLLPLSVSTEKLDDHANMVFVDFASSARVRCYLFEPNGSEFVTKHPDGIRRLTRAWQYVCAQHRAAHAHSTTASPSSSPFDPTVRVVGAHIDESSAKMGLQTLLGSHTTTTRTRRASKNKHATITTTTHRYQGYGICGAITFWFFTMWLQHTKKTPHTTLEQFYVQLHHYVRKNPDEARAGVLTFIRKVNNIVRARYAQYTRPYVQKDARAALARLHPPLPVGSVSYTMRFTTAAGQDVLRVNESV